MLFIIFSLSHPFFDKERANRIMSRKGKVPIELPEGVTLKVLEKNVHVSGPKGELSCVLAKEIDVKVKDAIVKVTPKNTTRKAKTLHGTTRSLIANMVHGVTQGWNKTLELVGTGYRAELSGEDLILSVGYSHPVKIKVPEGVEFQVEKTQVTVLGIDKELVGQVAAEIRRVRPPEPYKGKGIKYKDEEVRRKPGKAAKAQSLGAGIS